MAKIYYMEECNQKLLEGKTVAIIAVMVHKDMHMH